MESEDGYVEPLEKAYVYASKTLLELLVGEKDLIGHLRSVKHYFLMDQGDFIVQVQINYQAFVNYFIKLCHNNLSSWTLAAKNLGKVWKTSSQIGLSPCW